MTARLAGRIAPTPENARLSARQARAAAALVAGLGVGAAARRAGVDVKTVYRWRERADFAAAVEAGRDAAFAEALGALRRVTGRAVACVNALLRPSSAPEVRLRAARVVISAALAVDEAVHFEARLRAVEERLRERERK